MVELLARYALSPCDCAASGAKPLRERAKHVLPLNEAELTAEARGSTVRAMWARLAVGDGDGDSEARPARATIMATVSVTLAARVRALPEIREAVSVGRLGFETAGMVARVAGRGNVEAWIARAETRTVKHLREEIEAVEMLARVSGARVIEGPPDEDLVEELRDVERSALESASAEGGGQRPREEGAGQMSGGHPSGKVPLRMSLRDDLARFWRTLEGIHQKADPETSFVWFLCESVERAWRGVHGGRVAYDLTPHHIVFRSKGGGEDRSNLVSLCSVCHLELVHGGHLVVSGAAPDQLVWRARLGGDAG